MILRPLIPRIKRHGWGNYEDRCDHEGVEVSLYWLGFIVQLAVGRAERWDR